MAQIKREVGIRRYKEKEPEVVRSKVGGGAY